MDLDNLTPEEFLSLPEDAREALLSGQPAPERSFGGGLEPQSPIEPPMVPAVPQATEQQIPQVDEGALAAQQAQQMQEQAVLTQEPQDPRQGNPEVPLRAERERRRQLEMQLQQYQALLNDPQALTEYLGEVMPQQEQAPDLAIESPDAIQYYVQQAVAPLQRTVHALQAELDHARQDKEMMALRSQFPDLEDMVAQFDAQAPDLSSQYDVREKYLLMQGALMSDPGYRQNVIQAQARQMAEQMVAQQLKGMSSTGQRPVTLSGVTPAQANQEQAVDLNSLTPDQFNALPDAKRKALMGG